MTVDGMVLRAIEEACHQERLPPISEPLSRCIVHIAEELWSEEAAITQRVTPRDGESESLERELQKHKSKLNSPIEDEEYRISVYGYSFDRSSAPPSLREQFLENDRIMREKFYKEARERHRLRELSTRLAIDSAEQAIASHRKWVEIASVRQAPSFPHAFVERLNQVLVPIARYYLRQPATEGKPRTLSDVADKHIHRVLLDVFEALKASDFYILHDLLGRVRENVLRAEEKHHHAAGKLNLSLNPKQLVEAFLGGSILHQLFQIHLPEAIPVPEPEPTVPIIKDETWFRHTLLLASSGSGKTNTIRWRITQLLPLIAGGQASLIVMEPNGDLTRDILHLAKVYEMRDRVIILDPADVSVSVNIFEKPASSSASVITETIERIERVLGTVVSALTPQQRVPFLFALRALYEEDHPTMSKLMRILRLPKGEAPSGNVSPAVRDFFEHDWHPSDGRFIIVRLGMLLADPIFEALFGETTTFDLPRELNNGRLIVINSSAAPTLYSKFWIEEIARCVQLRTTRPNERKDTFLIIDEAQQFIGENLHFADILNRARGMRIAAFVAFQDLSFIIDERVRGALITNTSLKISSSTNSDITALARSMGHTEAKFITSLPEHQFAFFAPGMTEATRVKFPLIEFDRLPQMTAEQYATLRAQNRNRYTAPQRPTSPEPTTPEVPKPNPTPKPLPKPRALDTEGDVEPL